MFSGPDPVRWRWNSTRRSGSTSSLLAASLTSPPLLSTRASTPFSPLQSPSLPSLPPPSPSGSNSMGLPAPERTARGLVPEVDAESGGHRRSGLAGASIAGEQRRDCSPDGGGVDDEGDLCLCSSDSSRSYLTSGEADASLSRLSLSLEFPRASADAAAATAAFSCAASGSATPPTRTAAPSFTACPSPPLPPRRCSADTSSLLCQPSHDHPSPPSGDPQRSGSPPYPASDWHALPSSDGALDTQEASSGTGFRSF